MSGDSYLLDLAFGSIRSGLHGHGPLAPTLDGAPPAAREAGAAFVTVTVAGELNGCVGTLEPVEPLGRVVPRLAWDAAFADPRLPRLTRADEPHLGVKISVLSPLEPVPCASEHELVAALRPGVDGLVLADGARRATFLPTVWETLADPVAFVRRLQAKAGMHPGRWSPTLRAYRYEAAEIARTG